MFVSYGMTQRMSSVFQCKLQQLGFKAYYGSTLIVSMGCVSKSPLLLDLLTVCY